MYGFTFNHISIHQTITLILTLKYNNTIFHNKFTTQIRKSKTLTRECIRSTFTVLIQSVRNQTNCVIGRNIPSIMTADLGPFLLQTPTPILYFSNEKISVCVIG